MRTPDKPFWHHSEKTAHQPAGPVMHELLEPDADRPQWQIHADNSFTLNIPLYIEKPGEDGIPVDAPITFRSTDLKPNGKKDTLSSRNQEALAARVFSILVSTDAEGYSNSVFDYDTLQTIFAPPSELSALTETLNPESSLNEKKFVRRNTARNLSINASPGSDHMQALAQLSQIVGDGDFQNPRRIVSAVYQEKEQAWEAQDTVLNNRKRKKKKLAPYDTAIEILNRRREDDQKVKESGQETLQTSEDFIRASVPVIDRAAVFYSHDGENIPPEIIADLRKVKENIGADRYKVPSQAAEPIPTEEDMVSGKRPLTQEDAMRIVNKKDTEVFRIELQRLRQEHQLDPSNPTIQQAYIHALNKVHSGVFSQDHISSFLHDLPNLADTPLENLTHEQVAMILSSEIEISSRGQQVFNTSDEIIKNLASQLNERGLFYIHRPTGVGHDKTILHGTFIIGPNGIVFDLCATCTPLQSLQFQSMLSTSLPFPAPTVQAFSLSFALPNVIESIPSVGSGISLFARAFTAFGGVNLGAASAASSSAGERVVGRVSTAKPPVAEKKAPIPPSDTNSLKKSSPPSKAKPTTIFQSSSGGGSRRERSRPKPLGPKTKEKAKEQPSRMEAAKPAKKKEKPKIATPKLLPRRVVRDVAIFSAPPERKVRRKNQTTRKLKTKDQSLIVKKPIAERIPPKVVKPRSIGLMRSERKNPPRTANVLRRPASTGTASKGHQTSERRTRVTIGSFSTRLEQAFQTKTNGKTTTAPAEVSKATSTHSVKQKTVKKSSEQVIPSATTGIKKTQEVPVAKTTSSKKRVQQKVEVKTTQTALSKKNIQPVTKEAPTQHAEKVAEQASVVAEMAMLVGGVVIEAAKRVFHAKNEPLAPAEKISIDTEIQASQSQKVELIDTVRSRKLTNFGQGRSGGGSPSAKKKTNTVSAVQKTDRVMTASMRSLPSNAMIDVSDSFNTAREVRMWAQEAVAYPMLMERYYAKAA